MQFRIAQLILWPKNEGLKPRTLEFKSNAINLVTGRSRTGKSSITYIIDYVLGSDKCAVPVGPVRSTVAWYGLLIELDSMTMLVAREEPGARVESSNYCVHHYSPGTPVNIPDRPAKTGNRDSFKEEMNRIAGLPNLPIDNDQAPRAFVARPSFRDMSAFNFLPQHIVANPYTLFFKSDTTEHRQKLRTIFPFVLGAVSTEYLLAEAERADIDRRRKRLQIELDRRKSANDAWQGEAFALHGRAVELGLITQASAPPSTLAQCLSELSRIPTATEDGAAPPIAIGSTAQAVTRIEEVRRDERGLARELSQAKQRLARIESLRSSTSEFTELANNAAGRVAGVGWFRERISGVSECPLCGSFHEGAVRRIAELGQAADELIREQRHLSTAHPALERELADLTVQIRDIEGRLRSLRQVRSELEERRAANGGQRLEEVYRLVGRIEQAIKNQAQTTDDSDLVQTLRSYKERLSALAVLLDEDEKKRRQATALQDIGQAITHYARLLGLERSGSVIELDLAELTLTFNEANQRRYDYLWEIGSGANWMGYHISTMLALHERFLNMEGSAVPTILVIDQPSQVYYPSGLPDRDELDGEVILDSYEVRETRKIFTALEEGLRRTSYRVQVIVTEHADERILSGFPTLHVVADWHSDQVDWLIPKLWVEA